MARNNLAGAWGEAKVGEYLLARGWRIIERGWRCRFGELDLIARSKKGVVCMIEVKLRGAGAIALPREFVDSRKQERLRMAAAAYLSQHELDAPVRIDVAEVYQENGALRVEYLEDAFQ